MFSRSLASEGYGMIDGAPPPLHVYDKECEAAAWHPLPRIYIRTTPPGPTMVMIPQPQGAALGDDPTDPTAQTQPRKECSGMIGWLTSKGALR